MTTVVAGQLGLLAVLIPAFACTPSAPAVAPTPSSIDAGFNQAWNAVIDVLAEDNVPVKTLDKSSGFVVAELATMSLSDLSAFTTGMLIESNKNPTPAATAAAESESPSPMEILTWVAKPDTIVFAKSA
jgi:hypothetical protein